MSIFSTSTERIQQEYVDKRMRALHKTDDARTDKVKKVVVDLMKKNGVGMNKSWVDCYRHIGAGLREADLTINIDAVSWFLNPNNFGSYASMYERALNDQGELRMKDTALNPAAVRMIADDLTTLPPEWGAAYPWTQRRRLYDALHTTGASSEAVGALAKLNKIDAKFHPELRGDGVKGFDTRNKKFKAKAKEVFAALNYGRCQHGANTTYGFSYLVLKPELKKRAIYYPCDTFYSAKLGVGQQATYNTIAALIADFASPGDIWKSCYGRQRLPDTHDGMLMIEAHIHMEVKIAQHVEQLVLSRKQTDGKQRFTETQWVQVLKNAHDWCTRNKVRLMLSAG